nr:MAG TPA: hypothetical protein [Caudoviricetes sp.]
METPNTTDYLIIAHIQVPTNTRYNLEPKTMFLPKGMYIDEFIEFICDYPYSVTELEALAMPDAKEERKAYGLSHDRIMFALTAGRFIEQLTQALPVVPPLVEYALKDMGVTLERVPMLIDERSEFVFEEDGVMTTETYERFISGWYTECIDCLTQDYSMVASYLPNGNCGLLEMMNLFLWERGMWEMGEKLQLPKFNIRFN